MSASLSSSRHLILFLSATAVGLGAILFFGDTLVPFLLALVAAYIFAPAVAAMHRRGLSRTIGALLGVLLMLLLMLVLPLVVLPLLLNQLAMLVDSLPLALDAGAKLLREQIPGLAEIPTMDWASLAASLGASKPTAGLNLASLIINWLAAGANLAFSLLLILLLLPIVSFYLLRDWPAFLSQSKALLPDQLRPSILNIASIADRVLSEFLRAQLTVMLIMAVIYSILLQLAGVPYAFAVGTVSGLLVFIPYVGFVIGLVLTVVVSLLHGSLLPDLAMAVGAMLLGTSLESFFFTPQIVGRRTGLSPVAVLLALTLMGSAFGFAGVLLALPLAAVLIALWRHYYALSPSASKI